MGSPGNGPVEATAAIGGTNAPRRTEPRDAAGGTGGTERTRVGGATGGTERARVGGATGGRAGGATGGRGGNVIARRGDGATAASVGPGNGARGGAAACEATGRWVGAGESSSPPSLHERSTSDWYSSAILVHRGPDLATPSSATIASARQRPRQTARVTNATRSDCSA